MSLPPIRLIASDIDGTMLRSDGTLSDRVRSSLWRAHERGIHVVPTTGRPATVSRNVMSWLGLDGYWIFGNGAVTRHEGRQETVRCYWMDTAVAERTVRNLRAAMPGVVLASELDNAVAHEPGFAGRVPFTRPISPAVDDILVAMPTQLHKVIVYHDDHDIDSLYEQVVGVAGHEAVVSYSGLLPKKAFVEVAASLVTKATALEALCADLGIDRSEVASFGDNHNDLPMLSWAGRGYVRGDTGPTPPLMPWRRPISSWAKRCRRLADAVDALVDEHDW
ncbi:MAG: HAD hydrolase family protein [Acidimicrobiales bacterium]